MDFKFAFLAENINKEKRGSQALQDFTRYV